MATDGARRAVVLLSGGLDSSTTAAIARAEGCTLYTLAFDYGQRHRRELAAAEAVSRALSAVQHRVVRFDLRAFGGSALTDDIPVPHGRSLDDMGHDIPVTYVPGRNLIFLSFATAYAEVVGADDIYLGINQQDYSVGGQTQVWVKSPQWTKLMAIEDFCALPDNDYETLGVDPKTLAIGWHAVQGRFRHAVSGKKCYRVQLERGFTIDITEDHSLFTIDPVTASIQTIRGSNINEGTPIVVPFDLSAASDAWAEDVESIDLRNLVLREGRMRQSSVVMVDDYLTNRLNRSLVQSRLAFLQVKAIEEISEEYMYDLSVEGAENFIANGILAHNSGYPDCREEFLEAFTRTANLATKAGTQDGRQLSIHAPLIQMTKAQIIARGLALGVPYDLTWSCYEGGERACGTCDSCLLRLKGFAEAGATDPIPYEEATTERP